MAARKNPRKTAQQPSETYAARLARGRRLVSIEMLVDDLAVLDEARGREARGVVLGRLVRAWTADPVSTMDEIRALYATCERALCGEPRAVAECARVLRAAEILRR